MRHNDTLLELKVYVYNRSVDVVCVGIHEGLRGLQYLSLDYGNLRLSSSSYPEVDRHTLYVNGTRTKNDGELVTVKFKNNDDRDHWLTTLDVAVQALPEFVTKNYGTDWQNKCKTPTEEHGRLVRFKASLS